MNGTLPALFFVTLGAAPGAGFLLASYVLWQKRAVVESHQWRMAERFGYLYLGAYALVGIWITGQEAYAEYDRAFIALGWIAAPVLTSVLGIVLFASRQRLAGERWPTCRQMLERSHENRDGVRSAAVGLSNDLNRALVILERARQGAVGEWWDTERGRIEKVVERLRGQLRIVRGLEERYSTHLIRLNESLRDEGFSRLPLAEEYERKLGRLQQVQHDIDREFGRLMDAAVTARAELDRSSRGTVFQRA